MKFNFKLVIVMAIYNTKQKSIIEEILRENPDSHFTVDSLHEVIKNRGVDVGRTTVWRVLEGMVRESKANKYVSNAGESACYQYISDGGCKEHFHLKCEGCGRLIHLDCQEVAAFGEHIESDHGFKLNRLKTVFYGTCQECAKR